MKRPCFVHSGRDDVIDGFIEKVYRVNMDVRLYIDGEEYTATCKKADVIWNQKPGIKAGRYIGILKDNPKKIHLCTCVWTKEDIEEAKRRGAEIAELLRNIEQLPPAD